MLIKFLINIFNEDIEKFDDEKLNDMKIDFKEVLYLIDSNKKKMIMKMMKKIIISKIILNKIF